jgi:site-specific DNA recombinase
MLRNERYRGVFVWNRTHKERNPETGRKTSRPRPESEWMRVEIPEWQIVSEELWGRTHNQIAFATKKFSKAQLGGFNRTEKCRRYLFSGFLLCGICGSNMVIVSGSGLRGYVKYGCPSHRYRGTCSSSLMIRQDRLEDQLIWGLSDKIFRPEMLEYAVNRFAEELHRRLEQMQKENAKAALDIDLLQSERRELQAKASNVAKAIAEMGHSKSLLNQLSMIETEISRIDQNLAQTIGRGRLRSISRLSAISLRPKCMIFRRCFVLMSVRLGRLCRSTFKNYSLHRKKHLQVGCSKSPEMSIYSVGTTV